MNTALRPMSTGQLLDRTFNLYRQNFILFFGIALLPPALILLFQLVPANPFSVFNPPLVPGAAMTAMQGGTLFLAFGAYMVIWLIGFAPAAAATAFAVSAVHLGRATSISESYGKLRGRYGRMFNLVFSIAIRVVGCYILTVIAAAMLAGVGAAAASVLGTAATVIAVVLGLILVIGAIVATIYLFLCYAVAIPACAVEDIKARAALKRSVFLTKGDRGRIFVICFLAFLAQNIIALALVFVPTLLLASIAGQQPLLFQLVSAVASFLAGGLSGPIATVALSLAYYDERVRKEAFDLQMMMGAAQTPAAVAASAATT
jgi:hypothetical protein